MTFGKLTLNLFACPWKIVELKSIVAGSNQAMSKCVIIGETQPRFFGDHAPFLHLQCKSILTVT